MISIPLQQTGAANLYVALTAFDGISMHQRRFLVDTGATRTTIPKSVLIKELNYTEEYISLNKLHLPEYKKPKMADGKTVDVYGIKAPRINISGHEIQSDYFLTSDTVETLTLLLGLDVLRYFKFTFDFDAIDDFAPHGRMFYEFRPSRFEPYTKLGEPFAHKFSNSQE